MKNAKIYKVTAKRSNGNKTYANFEQVFNNSMDAMIKYKELQVDGWEVIQIDNINEEEYEAIYLY